ELFSSNGRGRGLGRGANDIIPRTPHWFTRGPAAGAGVTQLAQDRDISCACQRTRLHTHQR
ncbi:unnamed protein product, partial [Ectocarpus sp. 4 AP-2014]